MSEPIFVQNHYYCDPADRDAVVAIRRQANDCRRRLGLPPGEILRRVGGSDAAPWVIWRQPFADLGGWHADLGALDASPEFGAIRKRQSARLTRFDRCAYRLLGDGDA